MATQLTAEAIEQISETVSKNIWEQIKEFFGIRSNAQINDQVFSNIKALMQTKLESSSDAETNSDSDTILTEKESSSGPDNLGQVNTESWTEAEWDLFKDYILQDQQIRDQLNIILQQVQSGLEGTSEQLNQFLNLAEVDTANWSASQWDLFNDYILQTPEIQEGLQQILIIVQNGVDTARKDVQRQIDEFLEANAKMQELANGED